MSDIEARMAQGISPYIREGSGLKHKDVGAGEQTEKISPYIREGSGLKQCRGSMYLLPVGQSPLTSVRGAD